MNKQHLAYQINALFKLVGQYLQISDDEKMQIADLYPQWEENRAYKKDTVIKHGVNADNETQLYKIVKDHTSQSDWLPQNTASLYSKIGFTEQGVPIWTQPLGGHDAYAKGDKVSCDGEIWTSSIDGNIWKPGVYGWGKN